MALHKLPKGYSSDFRLPNKKPVGSVELDLSGLGRHTTFLSVMSQGNLADLRSGRQPTLTEGVGYRVDNGNMGVDFNLINARLEYDTPVLFDVAKPFSLLWVGQGVETTSNSTVAVLKTADSNGLWLKHSNNSSYQNLTFGGSLDGISTKKAVFSTPVNQVNTYLLTYNGKGDLNANFRIFINDEEGVISDGVNQGNNSNYTVIGNRAFSDASLRGWMGFIATFDADLSLFSKDLINSPYQILKPKSDPVYFTSDAVGGGGGGTQQALTLEQVQQLNESGLIGLLSDQHVALETVEQVNQSSLSTLTLNNVIDSIQVEQLNQSNTLSIQQIAGQNLTLEATEQLNESNTLTASQVAVITAEITEQINQSSLGGIVSASAVLLEVTEQQNQSNTLNINQTDGQLLALVAVEQANETVTVLATQVNSLTLNDSEQVNQSTAISLTQLATLSGSAVEQINQTNLLNIIQTGDLTDLKGIKFEPVSKVFELTEITKTYTLEEI